jgi:hypothetical protein
MDVVIIEKIMLRIAKVKYPSIKNAIQTMYCSKKKGFRRT